MALNNKKPVKLWQELVWYGMETFGAKLHGLEQSWTLRVKKAWNFLVDTLRCCKCITTASTDHLSVVECWHEVKPNYKVSIELNWNLIHATTSQLGWCTMMHFYGRLENVQKCQEFLHFLENRLGVLSNGWIWLGSTKQRGEPKLKWILIRVYY